jgi:hypothetical protein
LNPNAKSKEPVPRTPSAAGEQAAPVRKSDEPPVLLVRWYEVVKWLLERVESFPKNQRFIFGQRVADAALDILDLLVEAAYRKEKRDVLVRANLRLERLRWLLSRRNLVGRVVSRQSDGTFRCFIPDKIPSGYSLVIHHRNLLAISPRYSASN